LFLSGHFLPLFTLHAKFSFGLSGHNLLKDVNDGSLVGAMVMVGFALIVGENVGRLVVVGSRVSSRKNGIDFVSEPELEPDGEPDGVGFKLVVGGVGDDVGLLVGDDVGLVVAGVGIIGFFVLILSLVALDTFNALALLGAFGRLGLFFGPSGPPYP
jgi:hypothetical protein